MSALLPLVSRATQGNQTFLKELPQGFNSSLISFINRHELDVIQGSFNRSIWSSPWNDTLSTALSTSEYEHVLSTPFVAYDRRFLDIVGQQPSIKKLMDLDQRIHEAPSYIPDTNQLFFTAWGELKPDPFAQHNWQFWVDVGSLEDDASQIKVRIKAELHAILFDVFGLTSVSLPFDSCLFCGPVAQRYFGSTSAKCARKLLLQR